MYIFSGIFMSKITIFVSHMDIRVYDVIINTQHISSFSVGEHLIYMYIYIYIYIMCVAANLVLGRNCYALHLNCN